MKKILYYYMCALTVTVLTACADESSDTVERKSFVKIYDTNQFNETYHPVDIIETPDKGFLILAEKILQHQELDRRVYMLKTDGLGNFEGDYTMAAGYGNPLPSLTAINDKFYFVCMDETGTGTIVSTSGNFANINTITFPVSYPAAATFAGSDGFLIQSYNQVDKKTVFSKVTIDGSVTISRQFKIADDDSFDDIIMKHFLKTGKQFPFAVGRLPGGQYYFNGFYDYNFSFVTTSLADDDGVTQVIYGQRDEGGFSSILPLSANSFASSYFNFGANYFSLMVNLSSTGGTLPEIGGYQMQELVPDAAVQLKKIEVNGVSYLVYSTSTKSKQIGLYFYNFNNTNLAGVKYIGFANPFESGNITSTTDGGIAVCGTTYLAGRFGRISLLKFSQEQLQEIVK